MNSRHVELLFSKDSNAEIRIRNARVEDARRIQVLYSEIYGANYSMSLIYDRVKMCKALQSDEYFWLVGDYNGRIIASQIVEIDSANRMAKALGAVVSREYRKHNLNYAMMSLILDKITKEYDLVDTVYATTRTVTAAPQQILEHMGFSALGIFPNAHKVYEHETHCLTGYYVPSAWKKRRKPVSLMKELEPFYHLAQKELAGRELTLGKPKVMARDYFHSPIAGKKMPEEKLMQFEMVQAPRYVVDRFRTRGNSGVFANFFVPFHEPNLMLVSYDQKTEVYIHYNPQDKYTVILGGNSPLTDFSFLLDSVASAMRNLSVSYIECLVDAYSPKLQWQALHARFLPSAYFPAMRLVGNKRWDYIALSRSFDMLDFRHVNLISTYREYLKEYLKIWNELYVENALRSKN
jgi:hypothetical protein